MVTKNSKLVYSTDRGRIRDEPEPEQKPTADGIVRLLRETKGRKGKGVTLITGLGLSGNDLKELARLLKQKCAVGGAIKGDVIEIQTDDRERLRELLQQRGFTVKLAGG